jgi:uncharacterized protein YceK
VKKVLILILIIVFIFASGCASFRRLEQSVDDGIMNELRRYPCVDPHGNCVEVIEDWVYGLMRTM